MKNNSFVLIFRQIFSKHEKQIDIIGEGGAALSSEPCKYTHDFWYRGHRAVCKNCGFIVPNIYDIGI